MDDRLMMMMSCKKNSSRLMRISGRRRSRRRVKNSSHGRMMRKVKKLQKLIPGGKGLNADQLFVHTANYIMHLKLQCSRLAPQHNLANLPPSQNLPVLESSAI
ncbi:hypothetical protein R6Q59_004790 [Mikania micrantha]|uniref:Uncharacterized protein n=1 Tax=Mikania micrantha TaxID=192012 RepID=A0A5N6L7B5_9ASTR|nr:hypothetical protein E3N88_46325 [Mikania micrantha]